MSLENIKVEENQLDKIELKKIDVVLYLNSSQETFEALGHLFFDSLNILFTFFILRKFLM